MIPDTLKERDQWVCWGYYCRDRSGCGIPLKPHQDTCPECGENQTKPPVAPRDRPKYAKTNDETTWTSLEEAVEYHERDDTHTEGVGFMFNSEGLVAGVDLDDCRDPETGEIDEWAQDVVDALDSFTEVSPSGTGLHVYVHGFLPDDDGNRSAVGDGEIEMYDGKSARYFTVTGEHLDGTPESVEQRNDALTKIHRGYVAERDEDKSTGGELDDFDPEDADSTFECHGFRVAELREADPTLDELLKTANPGNTYESTSEADFAACIRLLHFGFDPSDVGGIMKRYRHRGKLTEDRGKQTYLEKTIEEAQKTVTGDATEPEIEPGRGNEDKLCFWKLRQSAVAFGILSPDEFIERETDDDTYLGFPDREHYKVTLKALDNKGLEHGRAIEATDGGAATSAVDPATDPDLDPGPEYELNARELIMLLGHDPQATDIRDIPTHELANGIEEILKSRDDVHLQLLDTVDSKDQPIYSMDKDTKVWENKGERRLAQLSREILGLQNRKKVQSELMNSLRSNVTGYWLMDRDELGVEVGQLPLKNRLLDLVSRNSRAARPEDYLLGRLPVEYDPEETIEGTQFEQFLLQSVKGQDREKLQEYAGYTLLKNAQPHKKALFLVGPTDSGKGTFLKVLEMVLGEENVASETLYNLVNTRWGTHSIYGKMVNVSNEVSPQGVSNVGQFKMLTGGEDKVPAEDKGVSKYRFTVTQKFLFATNEFPEVDNADEAFFNRLLFAEFPHTVPDDEKKDLLARFRWERKAILNWMLDGLDRLRANSTFTDERTIDDKKDLTKAFGSVIEQFAHNALEITGDSEHVIHKKELYAAFTRYCDFMNAETPTQTKFTRTLKEESGISDGKSARVDGSASQPHVFEGAKLATEFFKQIQADLPGHSYESDRGGQTALTDS